MSAAIIRIATICDIGLLLPLVRQYHQFEGIELDDVSRTRAVTELLNNKQLGCIWIAFNADVAIGYSAVCFGYSIEFGGRDGFIDELFISAGYRGRGYGRKLLTTTNEQVVEFCKLKAIHLEVAKTNHKARKFYDTFGFQMRENFQLMSLRIMDQ